jgi:uncharacterized membrane protein YedE/YeeE
MLMGSAMLVAAIGTRVLRRLGATALIDGTRVDWTPTSVTRSHVVGSALFGVGWAVALTCPGPLATQIGAGNLAGVVTGAGMLGGVVLAGWWKERSVSTPPSASADAPAIGL